MLWYVIKKKTWKNINCDSWFKTYFYSKIEFGKVHFKDFCQLNNSNNNLDIIWIVGFIVLFFFFIIWLVRNKESLIVECFKKVYIVQKFELVFMEFVVKEHLLIIQEQYKFCWNVLSFCWHICNDLYIIGKEVVSHLQFFVNKQNSIR